MKNSLSNDLLEIINPSTMTYKELQELGAELRDEILNTQAYLKRLEDRQQSIQTVINRRRANRKTADIIVSDHALLRYMERVQSIDVEIIRKQLTKKLHEVVKTSPDGLEGLKMNGLRFKLKGNVVTTVLNHSYGG